jgi:hypothetical protein
VVGTGFGLDGFLHVPDRAAARPRHPHRGGELGLSARAPQVQHEPARHRLRQLGAVVLLDQRERQVDAAVTPAAVHTFAELRTKIGSGSTSTAGKRVPSSAAKAQWVVARHPSSSPIRAARKAPVHTDHAS